MSQIAVEADGIRECPVRHCVRVRFASRRMRLTSMMPSYDANKEHCYGVHGSDRSIAGK